MKKLKFLLSLLFLAVLRNANGDIIPENSHFVEKCAKITNLSEYTDVSLIAHIYGIMPSDNYIIDSSCLSKGYKFSSFDIYAVNREYLTNKDVTEVQWDKDPYALKSSVNIEPYFGYCPDSIPINNIEEYYKIIGFTDTSLVLFKWKEIFGFNNGAEDSIITFEFNGDKTQYDQSIPLALNDASQMNLNIRLYPNPADRMITAEISNSYRGIVKIQLLSLEGKIYTENEFIKNSKLMIKEIPTGDLSQGIYLLNLYFGEGIETKKIVIK